ncbi:MAG TPA: phenylalanine--tRNA ligase subunit alpha [Planctomycetaceae bacterium]|jgi:phenylalanyl-tRNA synthetase alpha chain|nr:phenylalanine--tRNA ligase subunit alpha [Planctomycetaceae bacterium]
MDPIGEIVAYEQAALAAISSAADAPTLEAVRVEFAGRKHGRMRDVQALLGKADPAERPLLGKRFNEAKTNVETALEARQKELARPKSVAGGLDLTLPGTPLRLGKKHPLSQTIDELKDIMGRFGFSVAEGPEIENEWHNFEALNIPEEHPARDPLDNFYLAAASVAAANAGTQTSSGTQTRPSAESSKSGGPVLLRTQTSTVQIRVMEQQQPPVRVVSLGRVYRPDTMDASHSCMFHQMEGLMVDRSVTMAQLKTVIRMLFSSYLEHDVSIRFRPSFFPFTEPSVEVDIPWGNDWMEIGGAGMVDPHVLSAVGYDPDEYAGFAFGLGIERLCMKRHGITDIRRFYENDVRFLRQF